MTVDCLIDGAVAATLVVITAGWMGGVGWGGLGCGEHNGDWVEERVGGGAGWGSHGIEPIGDSKAECLWLKHEGKR